ncbi:MAG: hypothetical protein EAX86_11070 [Candidatus Heimdallarchaeota archaeon]|nr:hypothetical protein [Candidatus Heimdallarchaeota archaeon]
MKNMYFAFMQRSINVESRTSGEIELSDDNLEEIKTDPIQKEIIGELAKLISQKLNLREMVVKGFLWRGLREWQISHGITHQQTEDGLRSSPRKRMEQMTEILELFEKQVVKILSSEKSNELDHTLKSALQMYEEKYANR